MSESRESLADVGDVVRRTLAARTRDHHLIEDLTQETLVRVAAAEQRLPPDAQRAYAVVTARNLLASHGRRQSVHNRHIHRLVDYTGLDGPEQLTLEREETDALVTALARIDAEDRELLLRHEAEGADLATLADEAEVSTGAIAMRLARARASLRLEFLLAFRHVDLPTERCRPVLLALSAGDRRRQVRLDAAGHLARCPTCAALAPPITERNRRIAGWLIVPAGDAIRRVWRAVREHPVPSAAAAVAATGLAIAVFAPVGQDESAPSTSTVPAAAVPATAPVPTTIAITRPSAPSAAPPCPAPAPLGEIDATRAQGCPFATTVVTVTDVPADEGFWASFAPARDVWVHLVGAGESPADIEPGQRLSLNGVIAAPPADPTTVGLPDDARAARQQFYLEVRYADVRPAG